MFQKKLMAGIIGLIAIVWLVFGLAMTSDHRGISSTIQNSHKIDKELRKTAQCVDVFLEQNNRLPDYEEIQRYSCEFGLGPMNIVASEKFIANKSTDKNIKMLGVPALNSYVISYWRGEWFEYYASWSKKTSLSFDEKDYYWLGKPIYGQSVIVIIFLILILLTVRVWKLAKNKPINKI